MSTFANPDKAYVWLDGDVARAPAGTPMPESPFEFPPVSGTAPGVTWDVFGGIETGFEVNPTQNVTTLPVWNRRKAPYKAVKSPLEERMKMRAVDYSMATTMTALQGGTITEIGTAPNVFYKWEPGDSEDFAGLFVLRDGEDSSGFYCERMTLSSPAPRVFGGETLDGFEFEILALSPVIPITSWNPLEATP